MANPFLAGLQTGKSIGDSIIDRGFQGYEQERGYLQAQKDKAKAEAASKYTPEQVEAIRQGLPSVVKSSLAPGQPGSGTMGTGPMKPLGAVFPGGIPKDAVAQERRIEEMSALAGNKANAELAKTHTLLTDDVLSRMEPDVRKKVTGLGFDSGMFVPNQVLQGLAKPAAGGANKLTPEAKESIAVDLASGKLKGKNLAEVLGRGNAQDRADIYALAKTKNPDLNVAQGDIELAAATRKAQSIAAVQGTEGQKIGAVTASMEDMLEKARPLMSKVSPSTFQSYNALVQKGEREFNNPAMLQVDTYLTSAAGFYASMQKNGGTPDGVEREEAKKVLSSKLSDGGFAAVEKALRDEGASRVKRIKENQNPKAPGSADESSDKVKDHDGQSKTYTYKDGTKAVWNGSAWVKQ